MDDATAFAQWKAQRIKELVVDPHALNGKTIVDVGCGSGLMTYYLQEIFFESSVIGIDTNQQSIVRAQEIDPAMQFAHVPDVTAIAAYNPALVVVSCVIHHIPPCQRFNFVKKLRTQCNTGTQILFLELNPWSFFVVKDMWFEASERSSSLMSACSLLYLLQSVEGIYSDVPIYCSSATNQWVESLAVYFGYAQVYCIRAITA